MAGSSINFETCDSKDRPLSFSNNNENNNNNQKESCKELLKVNPKREFERYFLKKDFNFNGERKTYKLGACEALKQVKDFLPKMKEAQEKLSSSVYNIEDVKEDESFINMDIQFVQLPNVDSSSSESEEETELGDSRTVEVTEDNIILSKNCESKRVLIEDIT
ncbi:uncharacterized protein LOC124433875 [Xenia sp. Carnegie-2017]|uniref:uncharacterized protein LOC124433875 n=1 Tax=Xenia sp. Carnegie-2017 TaxID=2897299 RepID=UPI001F035FD2|nr:uncharacterized protein LOC124433875 [Xenia sp. Carnegie-2017]